MRRSWQRSRQDWSAVPREARELWFRTLAWGYVLGALASAGLVALARWWMPRGLARWDEAALRALVAEAPVSFGYAIVIQEVGGATLLVVMALFGAGAAVWVGRPLRAMSFVVAFLMNGPLILLGWELWSRARPVLVAGGIASPGGLHSFPSGHVAQATALYGVMIGVWIAAAHRPAERIVAAALLLTMIGLVALGRLRLGVHWPSDIAAGLLIGGLWAGVVLRALLRAESLTRRLRP